MFLSPKFLENLIKSQVRSAKARCSFIIRKSLSLLISKIFNFSNSKNDKLVIVAPKSEQDRIEEIQNRCAFYIPNLEVEVLNIESSQKIPYRVLYNSTPLLLLRDSSQLPWISRYREGIFNVDYLDNPSDGWAWHELLNYILKPDNSYLSISKERFIQRIESLSKKHLNKSYIFGTGPSLEKAINQDWSDGYRIVCNTIVRDKELWDHIDPHFIVAGDAIYHFGHTKFAKAFRKDLAERLASSNTLFVYPDLFHQFISRELKHLSDKLVPIPIGNHQEININLIHEFTLPGLGNVLALLLLPLGCTLSKNVCLFGFDGRAPDDKLFWSNSNKHTYSEFMDSLKTAHPCFFEYYVPNEDPVKYVKSVHGDLLDQKMSQAENEGWKFLMLHPSWTPTLQKRYNGNGTMYKL